MTEMRDAGVPFEIVRELHRGMLMDLGGTRYATFDELRVYTHRVAGVVGLWIAQLSGVSDLLVLEHAERMGSAMQLTNILRDVGEDWQMGRLYLPLDLLARHGLRDSDVGAMVAGTRSVCASYKAALRELLDVAHDDYLAAFAWLPHLPSPLQPCMAVAARLYEAIGATLVRNGYDNINARATTSRVQKVGIALDALRALRNARNGIHAHPINAPTLGAA
jgi:phytoene synthase